MRLHTVLSLLIIYAFPAGLCKSADFPLISVFLSVSKGRQSAIAANLKVKHLGSKGVGQEMRRRQNLLQHRSQIQMDKVTLTDRQKGQVAITILNCSLLRTPLREQVKLAKSQHNSLA